MMRSMADFLTSGRFFYLARVAFDPPTSFCKKVFPAIDAWHARLAVAYFNHNNNNSIQPTVATNAFVQVLMMLRKTFIRDLVAHDGTPPLPSHLTTFSLL
jgi:hypothetical protein